MGPSTTAPQEVQILFAPMLIGVHLNTALYGVLLVEMAMYYKRYKHDRKWMRYLALYLLIAETANVVFEIGLIYEPLITRYGTAKALQVSPLRQTRRSLPQYPPPIQLFTAWRVQVITGSYLLPTLIATTAFISFAGGVSVTIVVTLHSSYTDFASFKPFVITWLSASAMCDVILSATLVYSLSVRKTGTHSVDHHIDRIIRLTVKTGFFTAVAVLLDLFIFSFSPDSTLRFIFDFPLSKIYTCFLFSNLNSRPWKKEAFSNDGINALFERSPVEERYLRIPSVYAAPAPELHRRRAEPSRWVGSGGTEEDLRGRG
ncbi:F-box domain-containing protein [Mycena venus]|uniref:F-box domain-containing protein n=1 Tax=Mycena venus TaxID=2733690 RepID=A0A8H6YEN5_9AGAR|nr:F-box domain-containing protein [Mycena venus]